MPFFFEAAEKKNGLLSREKKTGLQPDPRSLVFNGKSGHFNECFFRLNRLLGPFIFTIVKLKKRQVTTHNASYSLG